MQYPKKAEHVLKLFQIVKSASYWIQLFDLNNQRPKYGLPKYIF